MPPWVKEIFCEWLPGILMMKRPEDDESDKDEQERMVTPQDLVEAGDVPNIAHDADFGMPVNFEGVEVHPTIPPLPPLPGTSSVAPRERYLTVKSVAAAEAANMSDCENEERTSQKRAACT